MKQRGLLLHKYIPLSYCHLPPVSSGAAHDLERVFQLFTLLIFFLCTSIQRQESNQGGTGPKGCKYRYYEISKFLANPSQLIQLPLLLRDGESTPNTLTSCMRVSSKRSPSPNKHRAMSPFPPTTLPRVKGTRVSRSGMKR